MMSVKLIFRNLRQNIKDYLIYFMTLALAIAVFYAFNAVSSAEALQGLGEEILSMTYALGSTIEVLSKVIAFLIGFLILYVNKFLLKRRKKELGIYMLLGMRKGKISAIFVGETFFIGLASLAAGTVFGVFLGQILTVAALRVFGGEVNDFTLSFCPHAFGLTLICFGIIYVLAMIFNVFSISGVTLIELLTAERKNEELKSKKNGVYVVTFILGIIALVGGVVSLKSEQLLPSEQRMLMGIIFIAVATVLIFYSISAVILMLAKKNRNFYYKNINSFLVRQLGSRMQGNFLSMSAVSLLLTATMLLVTAGVSIAITVANMSQAEAPYDFILYYGCTEEKELSIVEEALNYEYSVDLAPMIAESYQFACKGAADVTYGDIYGQDVSIRIHDAGLLEREVSIIGISDFNQLLALQGKEAISLGGDEFYFNCNYSGTYEYAEAFIESCKEVTVNGYSLHPCQDELLEETYMMTSIGDNDRGTFVVSDEVADKGIIVCYILEGNWNKDVDRIEANQQMDELTIHDLKGSPFGWNTKSRMRTMFYSLIGLPVFLCTYIGLIFLLICVALLAVQQLTEITDNQKRYLILEKQGVPDKMMHAAVRKQVGVYFLAPFILAGIYTLCSVNVIIDKVSQFCNMDIGCHMLPVLAVIVIVYGGYYVATFSSCEKMVFSKKSGRSR